MTRGAWQRTLFNNPVNVVKKELLFDKLAFFRVGALDIIRAAFTQFLGRFLYLHIDFDFPLGALLQRHSGSSFGPQLEVVYVQRVLGRRTHGGAPLRDDVSEELLVLFVRDGANFVCLEVHVVHELLLGLLLLLFRLLPIAEGCLAVTDI